MCIQDASLHIRLVHNTFSFWDKGELLATPSKSLWTLQLQYLGLNSPDPAILLNFPIMPWPKIWIKYTTYRLCVWHKLAVCFAQHTMFRWSFGCSHSVTFKLIQLHLLLAQRQMMKATVSPSWYKILNLRTHKHPLKHWRARVGNWYSNREATNAHGNRLCTIEKIWLF